MDGPATLAIAADGSEVAAAFQDGRVRRWDPMTGQARGSTVHVQPDVLNQNGPGLGYVTGGRLAVVDGQQLRILAATDGGDAVDRAVPLPGRAEGFAVSPSGRFVAVGSSRSVELVDVGSEAEGSQAVRTLDVPAFDHVALRFSDDEQRLFVGSWAPTRITAVDVATGAPVHEPTSISGLPLTIQPLADGALLVGKIAGGIDRLDGDLQVVDHLETDAVLSIERLHDGRLLARGPKALQVLDPDVRTILARPLPTDGAPALSGNGRWLAIVGHDSAQLFDARTLAPVAPPAVPALVSLGPPAMSSDGTTAAVLGDRDVELLDIRTGAALGPLVPNTQSNVAPAFSPDGRLVAIGRLGGAVVVDVATVREIAMVQTGGELTLQIAWSPEGDRLAVTDIATGTFVADPRTGQQRLRLPVGRMAWDATGDHLALDSTYDSLALVDSRTGTPVQRFEGELGQLGIWFRADDAQLVRVAAQVSSLGGLDVIDLPTGAHVGPSIPLGEIGSADLFSVGAAYSPARDEFLFGFLGERGLAIDLDPDRWATMACQLAGRNLTPEEWGQYLGSLGRYAATCEAPTVSAA